MSAPERVIVLRGFLGKTLAEEIACDEALLEAVEAGEFTAAARFWEYGRCAVSIGKGERIEQVVHLKHAEQDQIEIVRRPSAGGSVVVGPGCLNVSVVARHPGGRRDIHGAYRIVQGAMAAALRRLDVPARLIPPGDVALGDRKISGTAQASRRHAFLVHSTLLVSMDLSLVDRHLAHPPTEPADRAGRRHADFATTLVRSGFRLAHSQLNDMIVRELAGRLGVGKVDTVSMPESVAARARELAQLRYALESWTRNKTDALPRRGRS